MRRRRFLKCLAAAAATPALPIAARAAAGGAGPLLPDPNGILDLPEGFQYTVVSRAEDLMSDGFRVPHAHDGMAAFPGKGGRVVLVCNHELEPKHAHRGAFAAVTGALPDSVLRAAWDAGAGDLPLAGGTTTTIYNPASRETERQFLSLVGTELNCAGGPTPWGSWLSCEECFTSPGADPGIGGIVQRQRRHGYVFEVPADSRGIVPARPIRPMGRFEHEACAVHAGTGVVYMTEDKHHSLFYRYVPDVPGRLHEGGRLQALAVAGRPSFRTHNWAATPDFRPGESLPTAWVDLDDVDPDENDLRLRGVKLGAATFARGEGLCAAGDRFAFTCTIGGWARLGQVFAYTPSPREGTPDEKRAPGQLTLLAEASGESMLRNADNLTMAPWGDLVVCEDTSDHCGLVGIRPDGVQYALADNVWSNSELAGVCFAPDGRTLFVNVQYPGMTVAITGPFPARRAG